MKTRTISVLAILSAAWALTAVTLRASDPAGVYAIVEKVVFEPAETGAQRVQIWGAFALSTGKMGNDYQAAQRGFLYYTCPKGQEDTCRNEWSDIKSVAGKSQPIAFGNRYKATGRIRKVDEKPASPDEYPIQAGVFKTPYPGQDPIIAQLKAALRPR